MILQHPEAGDSIFSDAVTMGMGISQGGERVDPANFFEPGDYDDTVDLTVRDENGELVDDEQDELDQSADWEDAADEAYDQQRDDRANSLFD
jgi:hypothetical protein